MTRRQRHHGLWRADIRQPRLLNPSPRAGRDQALVSRPTYEQLLATPELATLAVLETALDVTVLALAAQHPELHDQIADALPELRAAGDIIDLARALATELKRYRGELVSAAERDDQLPF